MTGFARALKKAELHLHLEGSISPETIHELDESVSVDEARLRYSYADFAGFIQAFAWVVRKLRSPDDYALVARRLFESLDSQGVPYAEVTLAAGVVLWKEQNLPAVFEAVQAEAGKSAVRIKWIFDAVRQFGADHVMRVAEYAAELSTSGVVGFGIGGDEKAGPAQWFADAFALTREYGLAAVPHAGETAGPESIWAALELGARRIGHGIRAIDDPELMAHLRDRDIPLEVCISSNVATGAVPSLADHPVRRLFDAGVPIVLNTDDPAMFHTTLEREYEIAAEQFGFTPRELEGLAANSFRYALAAQ